MQLNTEILQVDIETIDESKIPLKRELGLVSAILLIAGMMIGTGIFKKIVPMAATGLNENYILAAWIVGGIIVLFGGFTFAGLAKLTTASGGQYEYLRICYGDFLSFLFGWGYFVIMGSGAIAAVGFIFSQSVNSLIPIPGPLDQWSHISIAHFIYPFASSGIKLFAIATIALLTWFNYRGTKKSAYLNNIITITKILGILFLILGGLIISNVPVAHAEIPVPGTNVGSFPYLSVFFGVILSAFWAYDGFVDATAITGEIKNPKHNIPIAIITGVSIVLILYVLVNYAFMRSMPLAELATLDENKIAAIVTAGKIMGNAGTILISLLIMLCAFGTLNICILFYSRYYYRMAQENVFFKNAARVHPIFRTPYIALIYSMIWSCILVFSGTFDMLTDMATFSSFAFYVLLAIGLIKMKRKKIIRDKVPGYPVTPILFILFTSAVLINTFINNPARTMVGMALILSGLPFYFYFKYKYRTENAPITAP